MDLWHDLLIGDLQTLIREHYMDPLTRACFDLVSHATWAKRKLPLLTRERVHAFLTHRGERAHLEYMTNHMKCARGSCTYARMIDAMAERGAFDHVRLLIEQGFVCCEGRVLSLAVSYYDLSFIRWICAHIPGLLERLEKDHNTDAMQNAALRGHLDIVQYLWTLHPLSDCLFVVRAANARQEHVVDWYIEQHKKDETIPISALIEYDKVDILQRLSPTFQFTHAHHLLA